MFGSKKKEKDTKESSKVIERSSSQSRLASGSFTSHALSDDRLGHSFGGVNTKTLITCPHCGSTNIKTKLQGQGANGAEYEHECGSCTFKWKTVDAPAAL